ncbi:S-adenosyl-L-methionine-dependent methyltransferase [Crepidotus variabilis]|uniref:S-adenosyl-L-methionine-dependent methyltransferase n=1 Tax=Crepidotus variabilis TaxID=179855 RepID=A0A9P6EC66_9AGAR|nr:S-adenosyl-L-methionine-dependent methyltransferase [Crepidotus variabilis]
MVPSAKPNSFTPKQAVSFSPQWLHYIQGNITHDIAQYALTLVPPITQTSIVHDNGCGYGAVTSLIASSATIPRKIHATDLVPPCEAYVREQANKNGWDFVETATMDATNLTGFANDTFTHSINNFILQPIIDPAKAAKEIYRTVKAASAGGSAIATTLGVTMHESAINLANEYTRGKNVALAIPWYEGRTSKEWLETQLKDAGFSSVEVSQSVGYTDVESLERWCSLMWSVLGVPAAGWTQADEEHWDKAIGLMIKDVKSNKDVDVRADGSARFKMVVYVAIASK